MTTRVKKNMKDAKKALERMAGGPLTMARLLLSLRECDEISQQDFARTLGISRQNLCDIEKGRKTVSPSRAADFAQKLDYPPGYFMQLALQEELVRMGLSIKIRSIDAA